MGILFWRDPWLGFQNIPRQNIDRRPPFLTQNLHKPGITSYKVVPKVQVGFEYKLHRRGFHPRSSSPTTNALIRGAAYNAFATTGGVCLVRASGFSKNEETFFGRLTVVWNGAGTRCRAASIGSAAIPVEPGSQRSHQTADEGQPSGITHGRPTRAGARVDAALP